MQGNVADKNHMFRIYKESLQISKKRGYKTGTGILHTGQKRLYK